MKSNFILFGISLFSSIVFAQPPGVVVVAGGGEEGVPGDPSGWNYNLYGRLVKNGDTNGDRKLKVVVMSYYEQDDHYQKTFKALGADEVKKVELTKRSLASDPQVLKEIKEADVVFFRGGDQSEYYKNIRGTELKKELLKLRDRGGAIGGTSAGAMSLAEYSLAGGQDLGSDDVLSDSHSPLLQDASDKKKSSLKHDFLGFVPNVTIDTHCGERARIGRILGVHAKATQDFKKKDLIGLCVSEQTGIAISGGKAEVYGNGVVEIIKQTPESLNLRKKGHPLTYTDLELNALTEGWKFDLATGKPDLQDLPPGTKVLSGKMKCASVEGAIEVQGASQEQASTFEFSPQVEKEGFRLQVNPQSAIRGTIGVTQSQSYDETSRGNTQKAEKLAIVYRSFYDHPRATAILVSDQSVIRSKSGQPLLSFERANSKNSEQSSLVIDCSQCTHVGLSPRLSSLDAGTKSIRLSTVLGARVHAIGESNANGVRFNLVKRKVEAPHKKSEAGFCADCGTSKDKAVVIVKELAAATVGDQAECEK